MTIAQIYEEAKRQLDKGVITIGEFSTIVDREYQEQTRWIPVSEKLPKEGQRVLVADKCEAVTTAIYFKKCPFWWREMAVAWMPLPEPYKEDEE